MSKEHQNDISIGEGEWIIFEDLQNSQNDAFEIDRYMESLLPMWKALETQCVSACCGIDAYDLWADDILKNTKNLNALEIIENLAALQKIMEDHESNIVVSSTLNNYFTKGTFLEVLEHLMVVYKNA